MCFSEAFGGFANAAYGQLSESLKSLGNDLRQKLTLWRGCNHRETEGEKKGSKSYKDGAQI